MRRVFITGIGVVSPIGIGAADFWRALAAGETGIVAGAPEQAAAGAAVVARVPSFRASAYVGSERLARVLNRTFEFLVAAAALAAEDAGWPARAEDPAGGGPTSSIAAPGGSHLGVAVGLGAIDQHTPDLVQAVRASNNGSGRFDLARFAEAAHLLYPLRRLRLLPNIGASLVSILRRAGGPSLTFVGGHVAGLQAIAEGAALIRAGRAEAMLCGGADSRVSPIALRVFGHDAALSPSTDPRWACRPFDRDRDGVVAGEGAAMLVLEAEDAARARGARPVAELVACASASAGAVGQAGCAEALRRVLEASPARDAWPDAVVAHGDGGVASDREEAAALGDAMATWAGRPPITSIQAAVGHTMSASGPLGVATAALMLAHRCVPPIRSLRQPEFDLPFAMRPAAASIGRVLVTARDPDGGTACALLAGTG